MIDGETYPFTQSNVDNSPPEHGVYELRRNGTTIYFGRAAGWEVTIRSRLQSHLRGDEGRCTQAATHYKREVTERAVTRERELLKEFALSHNGRLPECNAVMP